jgi:hypothetical protein
MDKHTFVKGNQDLLAAQCLVRQSRLDTCLCHDFMPLSIITVAQLPPNLQTSEMRG